MSRCILYLYACEFVYPINKLVVMIPHFSNYQYILFSFQLHYDKYNRKFGNDGIHQALNWTECEGDIEKFKNDFIYPAVIDKEKKYKRCRSLFFLNDSLYILLNLIH